MSGWLTMAVGAASATAGAALAFWIATMRERGRAAEVLRRVEGEGRAAAAALDELRRQLSACVQRGVELEQSLVVAERARAAGEARLEEASRLLEAERATLDQAEAKLSHTFRSLAADVLQKNTEGFLALAAERLAAGQRESSLALDARQLAFEGVLGGLVGPVKEALARVDQRIAEIERERVGAYARLTEQVKSLASSQQRLETETGNLVRALRAPAVRGRWGEIQLKRVVEIAGMVEHCDFVQQLTLDGQDGRSRPDLVVRLPGGRHVVVDAKVPLEAYLEAAEATDDETRRARLRGHAAQLRAHVQKLGGKAYWSDLASTPEFVVLFLPGEAFYAAALEAQPTLIEDGVASRVLIATPTTLIALLQAVHYGWREERLADDARKISEQGRVLAERVAKVAEHWAAVGKALGRATESYNEAVASYDARVLPAARRLEELGGGATRRTAPDLPRLDVRPRLVAPPDDFATPRLEPEA